MKIKIILLAIFILGLSLRIYNLNNFPPELHLDEAGYLYASAYIAQTGVDEVNQRFPFNPRFFGVYYSPVPVYITTLSVIVLGISSFSVRFPPVIIGSLSIIIFFLLVQEFFLNKKNKNNIALLSTFIFAISPWHIQFSRVGPDFTVGLFFFTLGLLLFIKALIKPQILVFSFSSFILSMYSYNVYRIITPIFCLLLALIFYRKLIKKKLNLLLTSLISFILVVPLLSFHLNTSIKTRFDQIAITNPWLTLEESIKFMDDDFKNKTSIYSSL